MTDSSYTLSESDFSGKNSRISINSNSTCNKSSKIISSAIHSLIEKNVSLLKYLKKNKQNLSENNLINEDNIKRLNEIYRNYKTNCFYLDHAPAISLEEYIERLFYHSDVETSTAILSLSYIDRIISNGFLLTNNNVHLTFLACFIISMKINEDCILEHKDLAKLGSTSTYNLSVIETDMLNLLKFKLLISEDEFNKYKPHFY